jgi:hypothetical protein
MTISYKIQQANRVNVFQTSESKIKFDYQHQLLPREQVWSRFGPSTDHHYRLTISHCNFYRRENHSLTNCPFIEQDV